MISVFASIVTNISTKETLYQIKSLRATGIKYCQAIQAFHIQELYFSKDDYYKLLKSEKEI